MPCGSKLLRQTNKKGGRGGKPSVQIFKGADSCVASAGQTLSRSMQGKLNVPQHVCGKMDLQCERVNIVLDDGETLGDCSDFVFGVRWSPEAFVKHAVTVGHPFAFFSGLPEQVQFACQQVAMAQAIPILAGG